MINLLTEIGHIANELRGYQFRRDQCERMANLHQAYDDVCIRLDALLTMLHEEYTKKQKRESA